MAIGQSDAYTLSQLRCLLPSHVYFMSTWQEQIMTENVCYFPLEPSNTSLSRLHCDPNAFFFFYLGAMKFCLGDSRVISSWSKVLVMCFRFLHMWQFLFHSWRGVDFVHLKCFRYFEGSRIRFFSDCEQFEESRPCLPGLWQAYAFSLLCNSDNFPIMIFQPSLFVCLFLIEDGWGCSEWYRFLFKIRMDIFGLTQHVLSWRLTSSEPFNFVFKTLTEVK